MDWPASKKVTFHLADAVPDLRGAPLAVVREALLPMLMWLRVPVVREVRKELTVVERFLLEAALALEVFEPGQIEEIIGIPGPAVDLLARRLTTQGALVRRGSTPAYEVASARAQQLLEHKTLVETRLDRLAFLYLPQTDDLLVFDPDKGEPRAHVLARLLPAMQFPVPRAVRNKGKHSLLQERVEARAVANLPDDVVTVEPLRKDKIPAECPAFRCYGDITVEGGRRRIRVTLSGQDSKKHHSKKKGAGDPEIRVPADLTGAANLEARWLGLTDLPGEDRFQSAFGQAILRGSGSFAAPQRLGGTTGAEWHLRLDHEAAAVLAQKKRNLLQPLGVEIRTEEAILEVAVHLGPRDRDAAWFFLIDQIVCRVPSAPESFTPEDLHHLIREVLAEVHVQADPALVAVAVRDRLWNLKHYPAIYALRAEDDFPYDAKEQSGSDRGGTDGAEDEFLLDPAAVDGESSADA